MLVRFATYLKQESFSTTDLGFGDKCHLSGFTLGRSLNRVNRSNFPLPLDLGHESLPKGEQKALGAI
jgi:hypothetical protein